MTGTTIPWPRRRSACTKPRRSTAKDPGGVSQPDFDELAAEIRGLYLDPPEGVLVVSIDEKTGIQAKASIRPDTELAPGGRPGASTSATAPRICSPA